MGGLRDGFEVDAVCDGRTLGGGGIEGLCECAIEGCIVGMTGFGVLLCAESLDRTHC